MPNMSYVRFENTVADLHDCDSKMNETIDDGWFDGLSDHEQIAAIQLIKLCVRIADHSGHMLEDR